MGYLEFLAAGAPPAPPEAFAPEGALRWSEPDAWGGALPARDAAVFIEAGKTIVLDCDAEVASLTIEGTLIVAPRDTALRAGWIAVRNGGALSAGTADRPFRSRLTITLCAGESASPYPSLGTKFLAALDGGTIDLHGVSRTSWVALGSTIAPGHNTLQLSQPVDWNAAERIAVASGHDHALIEERTITHIGADCLTLTLDRALAHRHQGKYGAVHHVLPGSLAKVLLLERNIVIEGCAESARESVGGFCLFARSAIRGDTSGRCSTARFSAIEFRRMGQFNRPGRYPLHWHDNGDAADSSVVGCLVHDSYQRGIVAVGSRHVRISDNVVLKPYGHGYIVEREDHSPQLLTTNLAVRPRVARFADSAMRNYCEHRPRAFWIVHSSTTPHATR